MWNDRTKLLIGNRGLNVIKNSSICIVGIGGVGGYVAYLLARAGIGSLTFVDFDRVDETNINRQIVATTKTVGKFKTDVMKDIIAEINPKCECLVVNERLENENMDKILTLKKFDFVVDAIDSVQNKVDLISYCKEHGIRIVSAMGAGNRITIPSFKIMDIYKTSNDGLAKVMRKKLREKNIKSLDVVVCDSQTLKNNVFDEDLSDLKLDERKSVVGSISYFPAMCGCVCAGFVIENLLAEVNKTKWNFKF